MVRCLSWREKVVGSVATGIILLCMAQHTGAQTITVAHNTRNITVSSNGVYFHDLIHQLADVTGLHFIYSSNKIKTHARVYLTVHNKPVEEVLGLLGDQLNLVFKKQDRHVVIKTIPAMQPSAVVLTGELKQKSIARINKGSRPLLTLPDSAILTASTKVSGTPAPSFSSDYFKKHLRDLQVYFDTSMLKRLPAQYIRKINLNNNHSGLFISAGFVVNDYSVGTELQAGIRSAYAVYSSGWMSGGQHSNRYGVGSSLLLSRNFSLNPVYTFAAIREHIAESPWKVSAKHHQLKLMVQYSLSKNVAVRLGPSFNYVAATYTFQRPKHVFENVMIIRPDSPKGTYTNIEDGVGMPHQGVYTGATVYRVQAAPHNYLAVRSWMGWEASISYKINFFRRP